jgi:hypothetical protein
MMMIHTNRPLDRQAEADLKRLIEPLADYICAANRPSVALVWTLIFLLHDTSQIHALATEHLQTLKEHAAR